MPAAVAAGAPGHRVASTVLHANERLPFVGRWQRGLSGGGPEVGERAVAVATAVELSATVSTSRCP